MILDFPILILSVKDCKINLIEPTAHAAGGRGAGDPRGVRVPAELACHAHPAAHRARVAHRRIHAVPATRLLGERAVAARPGAGHRHRGG